ncbi:MAG TPA: TIGR01777 family oxidoreductase [Vicinamibacteria bacterium]|nr:TIGR01777 family oxidoreductase [Vicinamibacteria bacterium]
MKIAVTGATGLIGAALCERLRQEGNDVLVITRRENSSSPFPVVHWNPERGELDTRSLEGVDAVVHLAGETIAERWTPEKKERIRTSRVAGTRFLVDGLKRLSKRPSVLIGSSAVGFYGNRGDEELDEGSPPGTGFLPEICQAWEAEVARASELGMRAVRLRTGIVLSTKGGALAKMLLPFKLGLGGPVGSGSQWMSWIHIDDVVGGYHFALHHSDLSGAANLTAPQPVRNADFTRALGRALGRPAFLPAPGFALKLIFGQMAQDLLLDGQRVLPRRLESAGYKFQHTAVDDALADVVSSRK